jgi:hypothetical protein
LTVWYIILFQMAKAVLKYRENVLQSSQVSMIMTTTSLKQYKKLKNKVNTCAYLNQDVKVTVIN